MGYSFYYVLVTKSHKSTQHGGLISSARCAVWWVRRSPRPWHARRVAHCHTYRQLAFQPLIFRLILLFLVGSAFCRYGIFFDFLVMPVNRLGFVNESPTNDNTQYLIFKSWRVIHLLPRSIKWLVWQSAPAVHVKGGVSDESAHSTASATDVTAVLSQFVTFCD